MAAADAIRWLDRILKEPARPKGELTPVTEDARRVLRVLLDLPPARGLTAKEISAEVGSPAIPEGRIRREIRNELLDLGLDNGSGARGYYIRQDKREAARASLGLDDPTQSGA
jgi:hypothetical protein